MPNAKRTLRIVPPPMVIAASGSRHPAKCPLCGELLAGLPSVWGKLPTDPPDLRRSVHATCFHAFADYMRTAGEGPRPVYPRI